MSNDIAYTNNEAAHRYEATIDGKLAGYAEYNLLSEAIMFTHTEVLPEFEGKGVGSEMCIRDRRCCRPGGRWR